jgi:uncharacterized protein YjbI with pentapeptide repeats
LFTLEKEIAMANEEHLKILKQGVEQWNKWRLENAVKPDLSGADLSGADLRGADLSNADLNHAKIRKADLDSANLSSANLSRANLTRAYLHRANLSSAILNRAILYNADLCFANLSNAKLRHADMGDVDLEHANLTDAVLTDADLSLTRLVETDFTNATITGCRTYGASAWNVTLVGTAQQNLIITKEGEPVVTVDDLEVAQFVYLLLDNPKIRNVLDTIGKKGVLILGRFTKERKAVLDAIRTKLRELDFVPMMFDFKRPTQRDFTETIKTLAGLSRFIVADITNPKSSPLELQAIMPDYMIPFVPIIQENEKPFTMFRDLKQKYGEWVLDLLEYDSAANLIKVFKNAVVTPALEKGQQLLAKKAEAIRIRHVADYA